MKILTVTNPESCDPIHCYAAKCTDNMLYDAEAAFEELDIKYTVDLAEKLAQELLHGRNFWYYWRNETYCFEVVDVFETYDI